MWTLLVLCSVITTHGVQGGARWSATTWPPRTQTPTPTQSYAASTRPSCRYNCGSHLGSCSCSSSCEYYGSCCHDYRYYCQATTWEPPATTAASCRYNCGSYMGSCSCSSSCRYNGNCCHDYSYYCSHSTTQTPWYTITSTERPSTAQPSCRNYCGYNRGSCSCSSSCRYNGNCCHDYSYYCSYGTTQPPWYTTTSTARPSCRNYCGYNMGSCSCSSSCRYNGNCCHDYSYYCSYGTTQPPWYTTTSTAWPSCRYNCGSHLGSCSCSSSCEYYGNCCHDYHYYCQATTMRPTTAQPSCRYNCGYNMGSCSCSDSCRYNGNCCHDYYSYCPYTTPDWTVVWTTPGTTGNSCGGSLFGSGNFSSPNYPGYYNDNLYCVWQLRAAHDQRISLSFMSLELENCCGCDYVDVYDGPSVGSRLLGKLCNNTLNTFYSTSNYMTVLFRTDSSVVGRGFHAEFMSILPPNSGRVDCSSDNMIIVIERSYLNSVGYDGHSLYLDDPHCRPRISSYQVVFSFPINTCGTIRKFVNDRAVYTNNVRAYAPQSGEITRQSNFKLNVGCRMEQDSVSQIMYRVGNHENSSIVGTGRFNTTMSFYTSSNFYQQVTEVPYKVLLNQDMYVQVDLRRGESSLVIFLHTCVASPSPHDFHSRPYYLVRNGCSMDNTYYSYISGSRSYARFRFKAFQFLRATDNVYIQCKVLICQQSDYNSRCRRGCIRRRTRDVGSEHDSQTLVLGPIQLKEPEKKEEGTEKQEKK